MHGEFAEMGVCKDVMSLTQNSSRFFFIIAGIKGLWVFVFVHLGHFME
jgi:hypothetical protein